MFVLQFGLPECCTVLSFVVILCVVVLKMQITKEKLYKVVRCEYFDGMNNYLSI